MHIGLGSFCRGSVWLTFLELRLSRQPHDGNYGGHSLLTGLDGYISGAV